MLYVGKDSSEQADTTSSKVVDWSRSVLAHFADGKVVAGLPKHGNTLYQIDDVAANVALDVAIVAAIKTRPIGQCGIVANPDWKTGKGTVVFVATNVSDSMETMLAAWNAAGRPLK